MNYFDIFMLLLITHFVTDYALQSDTMAKYKNYHNKMDGVPWWYWLFAHASVNALAVYFITGSIWLMVLEVIIHFLIDLGKCGQKYQIHTDQTFHIMSKIVYIVILALT